MARSSRNDAITKAENSLYDQSNLLPWRKLVFVFGILSITLLINFIDQNGIATTLPTIAADLHGQNTISWAGTSSLVANTTFQMLYGRLSDIFGRKNVYLAAIALLALADLLCGLSQNAPMFYFFRAVAGIGSGGTTNLAMIIVSDVVTLDERGKYQGIIGSMTALGNVAGPFLAAAFIGKTTWRGFFWLLAPLGALSGVLAYFYLPDKPPTAKFRENVKKVDWLGSFLSSLGVILLLIPISGGGAYFSWSSPLVISMLTIGSLSIVAFVIVEWRVAKLPMMPIAIYHNPVVVVMLIQSFLFGLVYQAYIYYIPLYFQNAHQFSVLHSALMTIAMMGTQSLISVSSGLYMTHFKRYGEVLWVGFGIWTLGAGLMLIYTRHTPPGIIVIPLIVSGIGVGCVFQPTLVALQAHSTKSRRAVIISNRNFFRCAGGAAGLAISAAVLQARLRATLPPDYAYLADSTYSAPKDVPDSVLDAYMAASHAVFIMQVPIIGLAFLGMFFVRDRGLAPVDELPQENITRGDDTDEGREANTDVEAEAEVNVNEKEPQPTTGGDAATEPRRPSLSPIKTRESLAPIKTSDSERHPHGEVV